MMIITTMRMMIMFMLIVLVLLMAIQERGYLGEIVRYADSD